MNLTLEYKSYQDPHFSVVWFGVDGKWTPVPAHQQGTFTDVLDSTHEPEDLTWLGWWAAHFFNDVRFELRDLTRAEQAEKMAQWRNHAVDFLSAVNRRVIDATTEEA